MKEFITKHANLSKVEFWAATTIFVFSLFFLTTRAVNDDYLNLWAPNRSAFDDAHIVFNYFQHYFLPQLLRYTSLYVAFLLLNFSIVPGLVRKESFVQNLAIAILTFALIATVYGITETYLSAYLFERYETDQEAYNFFFQKSFVYSAWLLLMYGFYSAVKYLGEYLLANSEQLQSKYRVVTSDGITAFVLWMIVLFLLLVSSAHIIIVVLWVIVVPFAIALYWYSFYSFIPESLLKDKPFKSYLIKVLIVLLVAILPIVAIVIAIENRGEVVVIALLFNTAFQLLFTVPFCWSLYKRQQKGDAELNVLKTALGQSTANFDFLRSQINPHFLFNALNTIYGTALQENAERTCEGIERLGDMMRFMLQENMQEKIALAREIDYLNNYIGLQRLRTDTSPGVIIQAEIDQQVNMLQISPMLLIPFVENAFKHGISLREPSHVKISLQIKESSVYFDVTNSIHRKAESDPEYNRSGIGLDNVKRRLQLLYPGKHELIIREAAKEYFVHLTINLA